MTDIEILDVMKHTVINKGACSIRCLCHECPIYQIGKHFNIVKNMTVGFRCRDDKALDIAKKYIITHKLKALQDL